MASTGGCLGRIMMARYAAVAVHISAIPSCRNIPKTHGSFSPVILSSNFIKHCNIENQAIFLRSTQHVQRPVPLDDNCFLKLAYNLKSAILLPSHLSERLIPIDQFDPPSRHLPTVEKKSPPAVNKEKLDPIPSSPDIRDPLTSENIDKKAARLIIIRRRKMKKHKLRKLRKKMYFEWAKLRHRRETRKEKAFMAEQLACIKLAENFNCEHWIEDFLRKSSTDPATLIEKKPKLPRPTRYVIR